MKRLPLVLTAAAFAAAGSMAAAQAIAPECVAAAANAGLSQTHTVVFDAPNNRCIATPIAGAAGDFGGLTANAGLGVAGAVVFLAVVLDSSGSTGGT